MTTKLPTAAELLTRTSSDRLGVLREQVSGWMDNAAEDGCDEVELCDPFTYRELLRFHYGNVGVIALLRDELVANGYWFHSRTTPGHRIIINIGWGEEPKEPQE